jgi:hypothetical protein
MRSFRKVCAAGLLLICTLSVVVGIGFAATPTPGPKSTFTPTPTPTRAVLTGLKRQLSFTGGGGSGPICDPTLTDAIEKPARARFKVEQESTKSFEREAKQSYLDSWQPLLDSLLADYAQYIAAPAP